jgi:hypothetical protein
MLIAKKGDDAVVAPMRVKRLSTRKRDAAARRGSFV